MSLIRKLDQFAGRPIGPLFVIVYYPAVLSVLVLAAFQIAPRLIPYGLVFPAGVLVALALTRCVPYLAVTAGVFYAFSLLPLADGWTPRASVQLAVSLPLIIVLLWRTWVNWPKSERDRPLRHGEKTAPWWGWLILVIAVAAFIGVLAHFFYPNGTI